MNVVDTTAPLLEVPADITAEAGPGAVQVVSFTVSASDAVTIPPQLTCSNASGDAFPFGVTTVTCTASDAAGKSTSKSFKVTVVDTTAPLLLVPAASWRSGLGERANGQLHGVRNGSGQRRAGDHVLARIGRDVHARYDSGDL